MSDPKTNSLLDEANRLFLGGKIQDAVSYYDKILKTEPNNQSALNNKGYALSKLKDYDGAMFCYEKALGNNPNDLSVLINKISCMRKQKQLDGALSLCNDTLEIHPNYNIVQYHKERILYSLKRYDESIQCCNEILKDYPMNGDVLFDKAANLAMQSKSDLAIDNLKLAISQGKEFAVKAQKSPAFEKIRTDPKFEKLFSQSQ